MKKSTLISLTVLLLSFSACKKETCECQQLLGSYVIGIRTSHFPINSTKIPKYKTVDDTINMSLYLSHRQHLNYPPKFLGQDYYRYETDNTEFRSSDYGLFYFTTAGGPAETQRPLKLNIDWFAIYDIDFTYQKYSMEFNLPIDSNVFTENQFIYDSLLVNDSWHYNILTGPVYISNNPEPEYLGAIPLQYYYSTEFGVVKFDMSDGNSWEIIQE